MLRRGLRVCASLLLLVGALGVCAQASAQARYEPSLEALEFFRSGQDNYDHGRYRGAADDLEWAL